MYLRFRAGRSLGKMNVSFLSPKEDNRFSNVLDLLRIIRRTQHEIRKEGSHTHEKWACHDHVDGPPFEKHTHSDFDIFENCNFINLWITHPADPFDIEDLGFKCEAVDPVHEEVLASYHKVKTAMYQLPRESLPEAERFVKPLFRRRAEKLVEHAVKLAEHRLSCGKIGCRKFRQIISISGIDGGS